MIGRIISETKKLAMEESDSRSELSILKQDCLIEEYNMNFLNKELESLYNQVSGLEQAVHAATSQRNLVAAFREIFKRSYLLLSFMNKFIHEANPSNELQINKMQALQHEYSEILRRYETHPIYQVILQEDLSEKELDNLILEKRNQLMRLSTKQEF